MCRYYYEVDYHSFYLSTGKVYINKLKPFKNKLTFIKFYSHQLMHFLIQICIGLLSYIKSN